MIKTSQGLFEAVTDAVKSAHSYDVPELIALPIVSGSPAYLAWMGSELSE